MMRLASTLVILVAGSWAIAADPRPSFHAVECEGTYPHHLQGVCTDEKESIFWCFTTKLVKTVAVGPGRCPAPFEDEVIEMKSGNFINFPVHKKHRVESTTPDENTVWLAVFDQ